ncbi:MAG: N-acetylmuramoyl-L-alanine amidase [Bacilli bacterium]|nr:N-acetylmuramoyl-L-alanine amidase [Bacilli bacterium]
MKKLLIIIFLIIISYAGYYTYNNIYLPSLIPTIEPETSNKVTISKLYIYGTNLNLEGSITKINAKYTDLKLILFNPENGKQKEYEINYSKNVNTVKFNLSDEINNGIYLDNIKIGNYELYLKFTYKKDKEENYKYYPLNNETEYDKTTYYTLSKYNNKITISKDDNTITLKVKENKDDNIYDIVIDPQKGGRDTGYISNGQKEKDINMSIANKIKEKLEKENIKVKLTRTEKSLGDNEYFEEYNDGGRAVIAREVNAKYLFSIEVNKSSNKNTRGLEIYTATGINYDFVTQLVKNIKEKTNIETSPSTYNRIDYGIYSHNFNNQEINQNMYYYKQKGYKAYNVTTNSNYMYMIRESGGIITGAYVDDSNPDKVGVNKYYKSNVGTEAYVIDIGYISNSEDLNIITNKQEEYADAIANTIIEKLK